MSDLKGHNAEKRVLPVQVKHPWVGSLSRDRLIPDESGRNINSDEMSFGHKAIGYIRFCNLETMATPQKNRGRAYKRNGRGRKSRKGDPAADFSVRTMIVSTKEPSFRCKRAYNYGTITPVAGEFGNWFGVTLAAVPSVTEFTQLFQEYRILRFSYTFTWLVKNNGNNASIILHTAPMFRTSAAPVTLNEVQEISGAHKIALGIDRRSRTVVVASPRADMTSNSGQSSYLVRSPWIQTTDQSVFHYGFWVWYQHFTTTYSLDTVLDVNVELDFEFRGTH